LKVDNLLAQYLYQYKTLSLPGIGVFTMDSNAVFQEDSNKVKVPIEGISFANKTNAKMEDSLVEFIKAETGKMKALAQADLDSYIALALQFINIGKPFYIEGVGLVQKNKDGSFSFNPGTAISSKVEDSHDKQHDIRNKSVYNDDPATGGSGTDMRKVVTILGVLATLAIIGWGGYYLYNKNTTNPVEQNAAVLPVTDTQIVKKVLPDTSHTVVTAKQPDSIQTKPVNEPVKIQPVKVVAPEGSIKFVFENTDNKARALKRFTYLKKFSKIQMETTDSTHFRLFLLMSRPAKDTIWLKDSLNAWYWGTKEIKVKIQ